MKIEFECEIKEFKAVKSVTNDKVRRIVMILNDDPKTSSLIDFEPDKLYKVNISDE